MRRRARTAAIAAAVTVTAVATYLLTLRGEYWSFRSADGLRFTERQYFCGIMIWEETGSDPPGLPSPGGPGHFVEGRSWRGFGILWRTKTWYE